MLLEEATFQVSETVCEWRVLSLPEFPLAFKLMSIGLMCAFANLLCHIYLVYDFEAAL